MLTRASDPNWPTRWVRPQTTYDVATNLPVLILYMLTIYCYNFRNFISRRTSQHWWLVGDLPPQ